MTQGNEFRALVLGKLSEIGKTQFWLAEEVRKETGLYFDVPYLRKLLLGERRTKPLVKCICKILDIEEPNMDNAKTKN